MHPILCLSRRPKMIKRSSGASPSTPLYAPLLPQPVPVPVPVPEPENPSRKTENWPLKKYNQEYNSKYNANERHGGIKRASSIIQKPFFLKNPTEETKIVNGKRKTSPQLLLHLIRQVLLESTPARTRTTPHPRMRMEPLTAHLRTLKRTRWAPSNR